MFRISKDFQFAAAHQIRGHAGGCERVHGHNYRVRVHLEAEELDELGMVLDFADLKEVMREVLASFDHRLLNDIAPFDEINPTAEHFAEHVYLEVRGRLPDRGRVRVTRVDVWESDTASASFEEAR